ncbi:MAG: zinc ribbon-containing protein [Methylococcaceae bacterium]|jgi:predicted RNA-binding protein
MTTNKYIAAYNDIISHLHETMEETLHSFADALEISKKKTSLSSDLSNDELKTVSNYVERDLKHAAHKLTSNDNNSFSEWLKFDIEMLENFAMDAFLSVADKTRVELAKLDQLAALNTYHAGDITSPGTFVCADCNKEIAFKSTSEIPVCPACQGKTFVRV